MLEISFCCPSFIIFRELCQSYHDKMERPYPLRPAIWNASDEKDFSLWNEHKDLLRSLYIDEGCSLKKIKHRMETEHGFPSVPYVLQIDYDTS